MKKYILLAFIMVISTIFVSLSSAENKVKVAVFTGGHEFDPAFWTLFEGYDDLEITRLEQPKANEIFLGGAAKEYDVLVLYDLCKQISGEQKKGFIDYLKEGKGLVALHHSIVSYPDWAEWKDIIGGQYITAAKAEIINGKPYGPSVASASQELYVKVLDKNHPVTKGISNFSIVDEWYGKVYISPDVHPLLGADFPKSMKYLAWTKKYDKARIAFIELGHDNQAYSLPEYRKLVYQAITWAGKPEKPVVDAQAEKNKEEILAAMKIMDEKWSMGEYEFYLNCFADNGSTFGWTDRGLPLFKLTPAGKISTLEEVKAWSTQGYREILTARDIDFQWLSKTSALITCTVLSDMIEPQSKARMIQNFRATRIFINEAGQWKLFHEHFSPLGLNEEEQ